MYKKYYNALLEANREIQHYSGDLHLYWSDVAKQALLEYWEDSVHFIDNNIKITETQKLIAYNLKLSNPSRIYFSSNACDFIYDLLRSFDLDKKISVLTSDSELYNFEDLSKFLNKNSSTCIEKVKTLPFDNFEERFIEKIKNNSYDIIFISHVFFNSGMVLKNLKAIADAVTDNKTMLIIDGQNAFMTFPTDLSAVETKIFYLTHLEKKNELLGTCSFLHVPKNFDYLKHGTSINPTALYRLNATLNLFFKEKITVEKIHAHIQKLQWNFREHLFLIDHPFLTEKNILSVDYNYHGAFLTFAMPSPEHAKKLHDELRAKKIWTDYSFSRLRFGFGLYQEECIDLKAMKN